jgi:hypothetical protein
LTVPRKAGLAWLFSLPALLLALPVSANISGLTFDFKEVAPLPPYCMYTDTFRTRVPGGTNMQETRKWRDLIGDPFRHMHHYCFGLVRLNKATFENNTPFMKNRLLRLATGDFTYSIEATDPRHRLMPEFLTKRAEALFRLGNNVLAVPDLKRAIELNPQYWPPYVLLSDIHKAAGEISAAREVLEKGIEFSPESRTLKEKLAELNGAKGSRRPASSGAKPAEKDAAAKAAGAGRTQPGPAPSSLATDSEATAEQPSAGK